MDERTEELASLHALDLLEGAELTAFETELSKNPVLRQLVDELREAASRLALSTSAPAPRAQLRERVMASVSGLPHHRTSSKVPAESGKVVQLARLSWLGWAAAACLALAAAWLGQYSLFTHRELAAVKALAEFEKANLQTVRNQLDAERLIAQQQIDELKKAQRDVAALSLALTQERTQAANQLADLQSKYDLANFKVARLASLLGDSSEAAAIAIWNPSVQRGVLTVQKMPALQTNQDYQLWVIDPQYVNPVDGGVFTVDPATGEGRLEFRPKQPIVQATKFAISREKKGGVPKAEGPIVMLSQ